MTMIVIILMFYFKRAITRSHCGITSEDALRRCFEKEIKSLPLLRLVTSHWEGFEKTIESSDS